MRQKAVCGDINEEMISWAAINSALTVAGESGPTTGGNAGMGDERTGSDQELRGVMADFLEMGHVENIMAMVRQDPSLYRLTGELLRDERFMVRMGVAVLFDEMRLSRPDEVVLAIPALAPLLTDPTPWIRGEAANILGLVGTPEALSLLAKLRDDPEPQIREIVNDYLGA